MVFVGPWGTVASLGRGNLRAACTKGGSVQGPFDAAAR